MTAETVILDCYTDEPSGYGVAPFFGTHQLHLSQALASLGIEHTYLTIDDLRYAGGHVAGGIDTDLSTMNTTVNRKIALEALGSAKTVYVVMGCFVDYAYFSCRPPKSREVAEYLRAAPGKKVLFYVMGTGDGIAPEYVASGLPEVIDDVEHGNTYRYVTDGQGSTPTRDLIDPDYPLLARIGCVPPPAMSQLGRPMIAEIETGTGCNTPTCSFCIEALRSPKVIYRAPEDIVAQVGCLYDLGVRHFRLGRQPNFFHYARQNVTSMERLLAGIRSRCPDLRMLHIDNVNIVNVITPAGRKIAELVVRYCTSGNVAPFGVESFDDDVRKATGVAGSADDVLRAVEVLNEVGVERGADGLPRLLPGINIIEGLPGETATTHGINLERLRAILERGLLTYRLYYRMIAQPTGVSFSEADSRRSTSVERLSEIVQSFVMPMQDRVYPRGTVMSGDWEGVMAGGTQFARMLGTCSIKVRFPTRIGIPGQTFSVRVTGNADYRLLEGEVVA